MASISRCIVLVALVAGPLAGCSDPDQSIADCQRKGRLLGETLDQASYTRQCMTVNGYSFDTGRSGCVQAKSPETTPACYSLTSKIW